jgi:hypothetical protein
MHPTLRYQCSFFDGWLLVIQPSIVARVILDVIKRWLVQLFYHVNTGRSLRLTLECGKCNTSPYPITKSRSHCQQKRTKQQIHLLENKESKHNIVQWVGSQHGFTNADWSGLRRINWERRKPIVKSKKYKSSVTCPYIGLFQNRTSLQI